MKVFQGPKGGYYILVNKKKRYLKKEEAMAYTGLSQTRKKKLSSPVKTKSNIRAELKARTSQKPNRETGKENLIQVKYNPFFNYVK